MSQAKRQTPAIPRLSDYERPTPSQFVFPRFAPRVPGIVPDPPNLTIGYRIGQWLGDSVQPLIGVSPHYFPFPYFEQPAPAPANLVIAYRARLLSELVGMPHDAIVSAPRYYPLVPPSPTPAPTDAPFKQERFGKHWRRSGMRPT